jgi:hypothetical protein
MTGFSAAIIVNGLRDFSALCGLRRYRADYGGTLQAASDAGSAALACRADRPAASAILLDSASQNAARSASPLRRKSSAWRLNDSCIAATSPPVAAPANFRIASKIQLPVKSGSVCFFMASACLPNSVKLLGAHDIMDDSGAYPLCGGMRERTLPMLGAPVHPRPAAPKIRNEARWYAPVRGCQRH